MLNYFHCPDEKVTIIYKVSGFKKASLARASKPHLSILKINTKMAKTKEYRTPSSPQAKTHFTLLTVPQMRPQVVK